MSIFEAIHINVNISASCSVPKYSLLIVFEYDKRKGWPLLTNLKFGNIYFLNNYRPPTVEVSQ